MEAAMLIGGEWRQAASSKEIEVVNPATEEVVGSVPSGEVADVELAVATAKARVPGVGRAPTSSSARTSWRGGRADRRARQGARRAADLRAGQADRRGARRGHPPRPRRALLRRGGDQGARRPSGAAVDARARLRDGHPPPDGRVRGDHALQLPAHPAGHEGRARAGQRQHGGGQARVDHAAGHARGRAPVRRGRRARRRAERRHRPRRDDRRRARRPPRRAPHRVHRRDRDRAPHHVDRRPGAEARDARARRLGPGDRLRGRRRRRRGQGGDHRPLLERRPGVPGLQARVRRRGGLRRLRRASSSSASGATSRATGRSRPRSRGCGWARSTPATRRDELVAQLEDGVAKGGELLIGGGTGGHDKGWFLEPAVVAEPARRLAPGHRGGLRPRAADLPLRRLRRGDPRAPTTRRYGLGSSIWTHDVRNDPPRGAGDRRRA